MNDYKLNGYLVQSGLHSWITEQNSVYRGMGCGNPWPLDDPDLLEKDPKAKMLTTMTEEYFPCFIDDTLCLHLVPDLDFVTTYVEHCNNIGIESRVLLCASFFNFPLLTDVERHLHEMFFLGYDYGSNSCEYSILADDLSYPEIPELLSFRNLLNKYGLFDNEDDLNAYIENRQILLDQGLTLEPDDNCTRFKVYEKIEKKNDSQS